MASRLERKLQDIFEILYAPDCLFRDRYINRLERIIKGSGIEIRKTKIISYLYQLRNGEEDEAYRKKYQKLIQLVETRGFIVGSGPIQRKGRRKARFSEISGFFYASLKRKSFISRTFLIPLIPFVILLFIFSIWLIPEKRPGKSTEEFSLLNDLKKAKIKQQAHQESGNRFVESNRSSRGGRKALRVYVRQASEKHGSRTGLISEDTRYSIRFFSAVEMKVKVRTDVVRKIFVNGKLHRKDRGQVYHAEEIVAVHKNAFDTRTRVEKKSGTISDLPYYKFMNIGEEAHSTYDNNGVLINYKYFGSGKTFWFPTSYLGFAYPSKHVGLNQKWGEKPGQPPSSGSFHYSIVGFKKFRDVDVVMVKFGSFPSYKTHINDSPEKEVYARARGYYYLDVKTGRIQYFAVRKWYSYMVSDSEGEKKISFVYDCETY